MGGIKLPSHTDPDSVFLKSLSIYIFKLIHIRNTVHMLYIFLWFSFQFRPHVQSSRNLYLDPISI